MKEVDRVKTNEVYLNLSDPIKYLVIQKNSLKDIKKIKLLKKIAEDTSMEDFFSFLKHKDLPVIKLSNSELKLLKAGIWTTIIHIYIICKTEGWI